jgi:hypothetical protein
MEDINDARDYVISSYKVAVRENLDMFNTPDNVKACSEYTYKNQREDAGNICHMFYRTPVRAISVVKRTKVGMDGLMIEIATKITTHSDNDFVLNYNNVFFITGMSNVSWEEDFKEKIPSCFRKNVYHHGKLQQLKTKLTKIKNGIKNALIIIDEIDCGDGEDQKLHNILRDSNVLDMEYMETNNIRLVLVSATMIHELKNLKKWGDKHWSYTMTIPESYIGHNQFLEMGIIKEFYDINNDIRDTSNKDYCNSSYKWVQEDILDYYGTDYRVHIIRTNEKNKKYIENACKANNITFKNHTSKKGDRISHRDLEQIFNNVTKHVVIAIKGFFRRANLIPNKWKLKIGATHEKWVANGDTNVQVQGLPGRMTGYWRQEIMNGHKTGPHRTSIRAIEEYEEFYKNPLESKIKYTTTCMRENFMHPRNINIERREGEEEEEEKKKKTKVIKPITDREYKTQDEGLAYFKTHLRRASKDGKKGVFGPNKKKPNAEGFYADTSFNNRHGKDAVLSVADLENIKRDWENPSNAKKGMDFQHMAFPNMLIPCYRDVTDKDTIEWHLIYMLK